MNKKGFTLIELIVVISIIALLISALLPAFNAIKKQAKSLAQRCQFRDIEIALEVWKNDHNLEYPDSDYEGSAKITTGAHKLTEALVGRDLYGFDTKSSWDAEFDEPDPDIYNPLTTKQRSSSYIDLKSIEAAQLSQVTNATSAVLTTAYLGDTLENGAAGPDIKPAYVFTDVFHRKNVVNSDNMTIKIGTPILYYKANEDSTLWNNTASKQIFTFFDNKEMMEFGTMMDETIEHDFMGLPIAEGGYNAATATSLLFQEAVTNYNYTSINGNYVPYNRNTFLLLSAGWDGNYGTKDDIWNISR